MDASRSQSVTRIALIEAMAHLKQQRRDCSHCSGVCCTFVFNSMQITASEAETILEYLTREGLLTLEAVQSWRDTIERSGLDRPPLSDGRRVFSRRRYTCPFFQGGNLGCSLGPETKPLGCLAYNPLKAGVTEGEACGSDATRESEAPPESWPIPVALLRGLEERGTPAEAGF